MIDEWWWKSIIYLLAYQLILGAKPPWKLGSNRRRELVDSSHYGRPLETYCNILAVAYIISGIVIQANNYDSIVFI